MTVLKYIKLFLKFPYTLIVKALTILSLLSTKGATGMQQIPKKMKKNSTFQLVSISQLPGFTKIIETLGGIENIILPKIIGLSNGGSLSVNMPGDYLCKLNNVSFVPYSDFIRDKKNGQVANEKLLRKEYDVLIPHDRDIVKIKDKNIRLFHKKKIIHSKVVFNLMGTLSNQWAHFMAQYYPKLYFLNNLPKEENIDLIILKDTDPHIRYLIEYEIKKYPQIKLLEVDEESEIVCDKLYHVSLGTFLGDEAYFPTPFAVIISNSTINFWNEKVTELTSKETKQFRKIFIGRRGNRSLKNNNEILNFFIDKGFEEIFPHLLTMEEKIKLFREAKYIVGPMSSGFINTIFSKSGTKILAFTNSYRYLDTYLPCFSNYIKQEFWFMSGKDDSLKDMNSSYEISLNDIRLFLEEENFLDNKN